MRRLLLLVLCCAASADWNEVHERFRTDYRKADSAKARRDAIRAMARADVQQAAVVLFTLWDELDSEATRLRKDLVAGRAKLAELQRKKRASRRNDERQRIINQILASEIPVGSIYSSGLSEVVFQQPAEPLPALNLALSTVSFLRVRE